MGSFLNISREVTKIIAYISCVILFLFLEVHLLHYLHKKRVARSAILILLYDIIRSTHEQIPKYSFFLHTQEQIGIYSFSIRINS